MRLLLAEDERILSDALVEVLTHNNYSVDAVYNGQDAIDYLMEFKGIGRKVAESICLYGLHRLESFPIDTHMKQFFGKEYNSTPEEWLEEYVYDTRYYKYAGYMRQSIFYSELFPPKGIEDYGDVKKGKRKK